MRRIPLYLVAATAAVVAPAQAAFYAIDFENPVYPAVGDPFDGLDGWNQTHDNPNSAIKYAWMGNSFYGSGKGVSYGGWYDILPSGFGFGRTFTGLTQQKALSFRTYISDSVNFAGRDTFGFNVVDGSGDLLVTVNLTPASQVMELDVDDDYPGAYLPGIWNVSYAFGNNTLTATGNGMLSGTIGSFGVAFGTSGLELRYGDNFEHSLISGAIPGYDPNDSALTLNYTFGGIGNGDNFITIDNIHLVDAIPEPTTALIAGLGGLMLLRRRRAN